MRSFFSSSEDRKPSWRFSSNVQTQAGASDRKIPASLSVPDAFSQIVVWGQKALFEWMRLFFSFALNELGVGLEPFVTGFWLSLKLLSLFIKQVLMVEPYQSFISLVETIGNIYRKFNKLNVNFSGLNTGRRNKEHI